MDAINSLIRERKHAFANLVRAYLRFNVPQATSVEVLLSDEYEVHILINGNPYKFDVSDYTGHEERYIFFNPASGRLVIENNNVSKVYKLEVNLLDD